MGIDLDRLLWGLRLYGIPAGDGWTYRDAPAAVLGADRAGPGRQNA
jgi:hypothetical protein